jgi:D-cysteine desulfhydrase
VAPPSLSLNLPTPVQRLELEGVGGRLWLKQDGLSHAKYGGNKARKLALLLEHAARVGARRVLTFGAAGSHHVLATATFAADFGLEVAAVLLPQPGTEHARSVLRRSLAAGLTPYPARSALAAVWSLVRHHRRGDYVIPPGGSNALGARAYALAVAELEEQVAQGAMPAPDWIVNPLGSGGTAAGLLAGLATSRLPTPLLAVGVVGNPFAAAHVRYLAARTLKLAGRAPLNAAWRRRLVVDASQVGPGYGFATNAGERATRDAAAVSLHLDPTYTAKAFAAALTLARGEHPFITDAGKVLYWHTLDATAGAVTGGELPPALERLFGTGG